MSYTISVDVDIDDLDIPDEDIISIAEDRGLLWGAAKDEAEALYLAFKLGQTDHAMELARKLAQDLTGKTL